MINQSLDSDQGSTVTPVAVKKPIGSTPGTPVHSLRRQDFHFDLPSELIAQYPPLQRSDSRLLALDSATGVQVLEALTQVNRDLGTATVMVTHNASIRRIAHRVVVLGDGQIKSDEVNATRVDPREVSW